MIVKVKLLLIALLLSGCVQQTEKPVVSQYDFDTTITVDSNYTFVTEGIKEIFLKSDNAFGVVTSSGAFDFSTCEVNAKCVELIDFTLINYGKPIEVVVKWNHLP